MPVFIVLNQLITINDVQINIDDLLDVSKKLPTF